MEIDTHAKFTLDLKSGRLLKKNQELKVSPKVIKLLEYFISKPNSLITTEEILEYLWPDTFVTIGLVREYANDLRHALDDNPKAPAFIETVHGRGYRYIGDTNIRVIGSDHYAYLQYVSISVGEFENMTSEPIYDDYANGLTVDLVSCLYKFPKLKVVSLNSRFDYKKAKIDRNIKAQYLLHGYIQKDKNTLRTSAHLVDVFTGQNIWVEKYDSLQEKSFSIRDDVIKTIIGTLLSAKGIIARRGIANASQQDFNYFELYDCCLRARDLLNKATKESIIQARQIYQDVINIDSNYLSAYQGLAATYLGGIQDKWSTNIQEDLNEAYNFINKALEFDDAHYANYWALAVYYLFNREHEKSKQSFQKACSLNSNDPDLLAEMATLFIYQGEPEKALLYINEAIAHNPFHTDWYLWILAWTQFDLGNYSETISIISKLRNSLVWVQLLLIASYVEVGKIEEAEFNAKNLLKTEKQFSLKKYMEELKNFDPYKNAARNELLYVALCKTKLPM